MREDKAAPAPKTKEAKRKVKKQRIGRKHESLKVWEYYDVKEGVITRKRKHCPRCGPGTSLSVHKDRQYCGRCGYTQFQKNIGTPEISEPTEEVMKEESPEEEKEQS